MSKRVEMLSQQEIAWAVGSSKTSISRLAKKEKWIPTLDKRNNAAKCYPLKFVSDFFGKKQADIMKNIRVMRRDLGQDLERKLIPEV